MMGQFVITLREGFEAVLLVAILVAYLRRSGRAGEIKFAYYGALGAIVAGAIIAAGVLKIYGGLQGDGKELFEGLAAYLAVAVLTYMIIWMTGKDVKRDIESRAEKKFAWGIALIAFIFVVREVIETVLFLTPFAAQNAVETATGATLGIATSLALSIAILRFEYRLSLRKFFYVTGVLLAFIASGLLGYGTHELIEVAEESGYESWLFEKAYDLGIDATNLLHHKGAVGSIFAVLFGYSASMEYLRVFLQFGYLGLTLLLITRKFRASGT
ncbi:FTR1 family protein [Geoglobus acetivorans]|uniref:FTR1 family protein n=1 Tax=Geoglobus acetivorans TaxID=565033 RepID=A0ABZ3H7U0_GEOAI|nr:FTR1 family protein [Geoglobus acetivorans]